ncbi:MAG TPA: ABC transporter ATP-binding protein [Steroidobacteraceae bacterium]|jgi:putative ABC transport system ATP-binding protein|nr:ABC transporter ATP-binding protein [Steroidobacteraceae bacterium]
MLILDDVRKSFASAAERRILDGLSFHLNAGEYVAVMGESGSGKSTLLNLIAGLDTPDAGRIEFDRVDLGTLSDDGRTLLRRSHMGFVFQAFLLLPHLTVARNIALPLALNGTTPAAAKSRVEELLNAVGLTARADSLPHQLSGGEMQRVAVARALAHRPKLVLADEPTGNLDADTAQEILDLLKAQLKRDQAAGILVTHSEVAAATTDRAYRLQRGKLNAI